MNKTTRPLVVPAANISPSGVNTKNVTPSGGIWDVEEPIVVKKDDGIVKGVCCCLTWGFDNEKRRALRLTYGVTVVDLLDETTWCEEVDDVNNAGASASDGGAAGGINDFLLGV